jgi:CRP/FNR family transcriptional regulator, cyclic AMP receptor protein
MAKIAMKNVNLRKRLDKIWEAPNFTSFFNKYTTRSPMLIKAGRTVFFEEDEPGRIYFIKKGFIKLFRTSPEGRSTTIYLYGPGSILALRALTSKDKKLKHTAEAMTDAEILTITEKEYFDTISENPEYIVDLLHAFIERLNYTERKLEGFILTDTTARIASFMYDLAERFGEPASPNASQGGKSDGKIVIPLPLTHQTISEFVGAFRETTTVAMNRLRKDGIMSDKRGKITILDMKKLREQALI